jgi:hypothetical protein
MGPLGGFVGVGVGDDGRVVGGWSSAPAAAGCWWGGGWVVEAGFLSSSVGLAVQDEFVGGGLEAVDRGLGEEGVGHLGEPFDGFTVGGDHGGGGAVAFDDELVDIRGVEGVEGLEGEIIEDEEVDTDEFAELGVVTVIEAGRSEPFEEDVGAFEHDAVTAADRGVAESSSHERFADPDGTQNHGVIAGPNETGSTARPRFDGRS